MILIIIQLSLPNACHGYRCSRQVLPFDAALESPSSLSGITGSIFTWLFKAKFSFLMTVSRTLSGSIWCMVCLLSSFEHCLQVF